jgi:hypothetical protein
MKGGKIEEGRRERWKEGKEKGKENERKGREGTGGKGRREEGRT